MEGSIPGGLGGFRAWGCFPEEPAGRRFLLLPCRWAKVFWPVREKAGRPWPERWCGLQRIIPAHRPGLCHLSREGLLPDPPGKESAAPAFCAAEGGSPSVGIQNQRNELQVTLSVVEQAVPLAVLTDRDITGLDGDLAVIVRIQALAFQNIADFLLALVRVGADFPGRPCFPVALAAGRGACVR